MTIANLLITAALLAGGGIPLSQTASSASPAETRLDQAYLNALSQISETRRVVGSDFHRWRDQKQWDAVREAVSNPDLLYMDSAQRQALLHERYDLIRAVEKYPLWERMPGHAAISMQTLSLWQVSRNNFLRLILKLPK